jgi:hypothetical protein
LFGFKLPGPQRLQSLKGVMLRTARTHVKAEGRLSWEEHKSCLQSKEIVMTSIKLEHCDLHTLSI